MVSTGPVQVQDKVAFHINNLSTSNLGPKAADIKKVLTPEHWPWFANYVVVKRAAQEPNFHGLYIDVRSCSQMCHNTCVVSIVLHAKAAPSLLHSAL